MGVGKELQRVFDVPVKPLIQGRCETIYARISSILGNLIKVQERAALGQPGNALITPKDTGSGKESIELFGG